MRSGATAEEFMRACLWFKALGETRRAWLQRVRERMKWWTKERRDDATRTDR